jgi:putative transport protein
VIDLLADEPMVLLGTVLVVGALIGSIRIRGVSLGPAGALFAGLAASAIDDRLVIASTVGIVGLSLFTYCVGLSTGADFVRGFRRTVPLMGAVAGAMLALALAAGLLGDVFGLARATTAGTYAGALTNTPALAGAQSLLPTAERATPVVGYALAYPFGVVGMLLAVVISGRLKRSSAETDPSAAGLSSMTVRVGDGRPASVGALSQQLGVDAVVARLQRDDRQWVPDDDDRLQRNDVLAVTCRSDRCETVAAIIGNRLTTNLADSRRELDFRRMVVSNNAIVGRSISELGFGSQFGATITRVRRGRNDMLATPDLVLEPGDRVRVVAPPHSMDAVASRLGDDEHRVSEFSPPGFTLGLFIGLLVGVIPVPIPNVGDVSLGAAGGPLIIGLILGWRHRSGPLVWQVPHGVSVTLRQLGSMIFLAMAGTSGGAALRVALQSREALTIGALGLVITTLSAAAVLTIASMSGLDSASTAGLLAGAQTQPAVLAFGAERTSSPRLMMHYAIATPVAMVVKIVAAQLLVLL